MFAATQWYNKLHQTPLPQRHGVTCVAGTAQQVTPRLRHAHAAGLVLKVFLIILPAILAIMNRFAGMVSVSQVDFGVVEKYYIFQLFTVFLATAIAGTMLSQVTVCASCGLPWGGNRLQWCKGCSVAWQLCARLHTTPQSLFRNHVKEIA
jgi:hypothetical protein